MEHQTTEAWTASCQGHPLLPKFLSEQAPRANPGHSTGSLHWIHLLLEQEQHSPAGPMPAGEGHTVCLLTELQAALHTSPSKGSWGLSLKAAGHQTCCLLTPQGTRSRLSQPNKPRHWLAPFLEMGQPPWASSVPSIQCPDSLGTFFTWSLFLHNLHLKIMQQFISLLFLYYFHYFLCPSISLFSV